MFLTLLIFCVGNVCAEEPDNITNDLDSSLPDANFNNTTSDLVNISHKDKCYNSVYEANKDFFNLVKAQRVNNTTDYYMELCKKPELRNDYYKERLGKLKMNITYYLRNIDNEINSYLTLKINSLNNIYNNLENSKPTTNKSKLINSASKNVNQSLTAVKGYSETLNFYFNEIKTYFYLKDLLSKNNVTINDTFNVDKSIISNLKEKIKILQSIEKSLNLLSKDLKIINNLKIN